MTVPRLNIPAMPRRRIGWRINAIIGAASLAYAVWDALAVGLTVYTAIYGGLALVYAWLVLNARAYNRRQDLLERELALAALNAWVAGSTAIMRRRASARNN